MKKLLPVGLVVLFLVACTASDKACTFETNAHNFYTTFVAPFRSQAQIAKEAAFYAKVMTVCSLTGSVAYQTASAQAAEARK